MPGKIFPFGSVEVSLPALQTLAVYSAGKANVFRLVGVIGGRVSRHGLGSISGTTVNFGPYTGNIVVLIEAGPYGAEYDVGFVPRTSNNAPARPVKPLDRYINITGDSRTANSIGVSGNTVTFENYGHGAWLPTMSNGSVSISVARESATPGHTTADWLGNMAAYIAAGGDVFVNMIGTNDRNSSSDFSLSRSKRNIETGIRMQIDAGIVPLMYAEIPRGGANALTGTQLSNHIGLREWAIDRLPDLGCRVADAWPALIDTENEAAGLPISSYFVDGLHPNGIGAPLIARTMAPYLLEIYGSPLILPTYDEQFDATSAKTGWLNVNPLLLGTGGTKSASANATGVVADGWTLAGSSWTGATVVASKESNPDGGEYQVLDLGGTPTSTGSTLTFEQTLDLADLSTSDVLRAIGLVQFENLSGVGGVDIEIRFVRSAVATFMKALDRYVEGSFMWSGPFQGPQETPYYTVDKAIDTEVKIRFVVYGCQNIPIRGRVRVGQFGSEKVI